MRLIPAIAVTTSLVVSYQASASIGSWPEEPGYIYTNTPASELANAGFTDVTASGNLVCVPSWCAGCYTQDNVETNSLMGFVEIDVTYVPSDAQYGFFFWMDIDYTDPNFQLADMAALIAQSDPDVTVLSTDDAGTDWSPFSDWIEDPDATVFHWMPSEFDPDSTNPFETTTLTFGWNFSGYEGLNGSPFPGIVVNGAGSVPAPSAIGLLAIAGFTTRRRRQ